MFSFITIFFFYQLLPFLDELHGDLLRRQYSAYPLVTVPEADKGAFIQPLTLSWYDKEEVLMSIEQVKSPSLLFAMFASANAKTLYEAMNKQGFGCSLAKMTTSFLLYFNPAGALANRLFATEKNWRAVKAAFSLVIINGWLRHVEGDMLQKNGVNQLTAGHWKIHQIIWREAGMN